MLKSGQVVRAAAVAVLCLAFVNAAGAQAAPPLPNDSLELGRNYARWFFTGQVDSLWAAVEPGMTGPLASRDALFDMMNSVAQRTGRVGAVQQEQFIWRNGARQFATYVTVSELGEPLVLRWVMRANGRIQGSGIGPQSGTPPSDSAGPVIRSP